MDASIGSVSTTSYVAPRGVEAAALPRVAQAPKTASSDNQSSSNQNSRRETAPDVATGALVYRIVDVATGDVTAQTPTESRLQLRAYIDSVVGQDETGSTVVRSA